MITKTVVGTKIAEIRKKWAIFEELYYANETLDEAICILDDLKILIRQLPFKLANSVEQAKALVESVMIMDASLEKCMETTVVCFDEIEIKLDEMQKALLHDEVDKLRRFSKLVFEVRRTQKLIDTTIANAEEEIYKFLETEDLFVERQKMENRIMELILSS